MKTLQRIQITFKVFTMAMRAVAQAWADSNRVPMGASGSLIYKLELEIKGH
jgi:hypothetical protein